MRFAGRRPTLPDPAAALPNRDRRAFPVPAKHAVLGRSLEPPFPEHTESVLFGMGCFWGAERVFWTEPGVWTTAVGYAGGSTHHPTYEEVCSGQTGHAEVVLVVYEPAVVSFEALLARFWEHHDPTQGMRQGNDVGTQYRSAVFVTSDQQRELAEASRDRYQQALADAGHGSITTEIQPAPSMFYAEPYHQQYLHTVPHGYCGLGGTGVACPTGLDTR